MVCVVLCCVVCGGLSWPPVALALSSCVSCLLREEEIKWTALAFLYRYEETAGGPPPPERERGGWSGIEREGGREGGRDGGRESERECCTSGISRLAVLSSMCDLSGSGVTATVLPDYGWSFD